MSEDSCFKIKKLHKSYWNKIKCDTASTLNVQNTKKGFTTHSGEICLQQDTAVVFKQLLQDGSKIMSY